MYGLGFPELPFSLRRPVTQRVSVRTISRSGIPMFMSSAVMYCPPRLSTNRPMAWNRPGDLVVFGSPITTDFPPPRPVSAIADL